MGEKRSEGTNARRMGPEAVRTESESGTTKADVLVNLTERQARLLGDAADCCSMSQRQRQVGGLLRRGLPDDQQNVDGD